MLILINLKSLLATFSTNLAERVRNYKSRGLQSSVITHKKEINYVDSPKAWKVKRNFNIKKHNYFKILQKPVN